MKIIPIYYINGKYLPKNKAFISVLDIGLLRGYGVFDFLVTYRGIPFLLNEHVNRLFGSAWEIGLKIGINKSEIKNVILNTLKKNTWKGERSVRIVVTGGVGANTTSPSDNPTIIVTVDPKHIYPNSYYEKGVKVITFPYTRPHALVKSLEYSTAIKALDQANKHNAIEAIYFDNDSKKISEATTSNIFVIKKNRIYSPKTNILEGVTRNLVIKLLKKVNPVVEKEISTEELLNSDEIFITASNKEIIPVVKIDNKKVGSGRVETVTKEVMELFQNYVNDGDWK